jgi:hypothetical protein
VWLSKKSFSSPSLILATTTTSHQTICPLKKNSDSNSGVFISFVFATISEINSSLFFSTKSLNHLL